MKKILLVGTNEGSFDYNRNLKFDQIKNSQIEVQLHADMVFREGIDKVLIQISIRYLLEKEQILNYSISLLFKVQDWDVYFKEMSNNDLLASDETHRMLSVAVGFLRGSLSLQERSTPFKGAFLPLIDIDALSKEVSVNRLKESK